MTRRRLLTLGLVAALLGAGPVPLILAGSAEAHVSRFVPMVDVVPEPAAPLDAMPTLMDLAWTAAPSTAGVPWPLLAVLAGLTALGARRPRRSLVLALVVVLAVFAFENGVHSVHHLNDQDRGQHCAVAAASQHVAGTEVVGALGADVPAPAEPATVVPVRVIRSVRTFGPDQGRAPPVSPA